ncbi:hypothetical protein OH76DRAFT_1485715 [Lentinus brumalis]|uniref:F-box domain-containing protein n=1 Tax=Lentinus brumalis TaxID=2498619 RepID=A0A371D0W0_9APHY|nr:hypothetical protein OH76DRAFT_1485715 [Polyporus brumalis]
MSSAIGSDSPLRRLGIDVLLMVLDELRAQRALRPFSATCRYVLSLSKPLLFRSWRMTDTFPFEKYSHWFPAHVRPHVRLLSILDGCLDRRSCIDQYEDMKSTNNRHHVCGSLGPVLFERVLGDAPQLYSLTITGRGPAMHGMTWAALKVILSTPHLRELKISRGMLLCARLSAADVEDMRTTDSLAPLSELIYEVDSSEVSESFPAEMQVLTAILPKLAESLTALVLPGTRAPLHIIRGTRWPNLREFALRSKHWDVTVPPRPYASLVAQMPNLRSLTLELTPPASNEDVFVRPIGYTAGDRLQWPALEHLTISHPHPDDAIYEHLHPTLRSLSLRCWPPLVMVSWPYRTEDRLRTSSQMLHILLKCATSVHNLTSLHIEYEMDDEEIALLSHIASAFPHMIELQIHRIRPLATTDASANTNTNTVIASMVGECLAPLAQLRTLRVHMKFDDVPKRHPARRGWMYFRRDELWDFVQGTLKEAATMLARSLAHSVESVALLDPESSWRRFLVRDESSGSRAERKVTYDDAYYLQQSLPNQLIFY